jgi:hypothetical protein
MNINNMLNNILGKSNRKTTVPNNILKQPTIKFSTFNTNLLNNKEKKTNIIKDNVFSKNRLSDDFYKEQQYYKPLDKRSKMVFAKTPNLSDKRIWYREENDPFGNKIIVASKGHGIKATQSDKAFDTISYVLDNMPHKARNLDIYQHTHPYLFDTDKYQDEMLEKGNKYDKEGNWNQEKVDLAKNILQHDIAIGMAQFHKSDNPTINLMPYKKMLIGKDKDNTIPSVLKHEIGHTNEPMNLGEEFKNVKNLTNYGNINPEEKFADNFVINLDYNKKYKEYDPEKNLHKTISSKEYFNKNLPKQKTNREEWEEKHSPEFYIKEALEKDKNKKDMGVKMDKLYADSYKIMEENKEIPQVYDLKDELDKEYSMYRKLEENKNKFTDKEKAYIALKNAAILLRKDTQMNNIINPLAKKVESYLVKKHAREALGQHLFDKTKFTEEENEKLKKLLNEAEAPNLKENPSKDDNSTNMEVPKKYDIKIANKPVIVHSKKNTPCKKTIHKIYSKIDDDITIPLQFMTKKQYLQQYIKNQEKKKDIDFPKEQEDEYIKEGLKDMKYVIARYTTKKNPYYHPATIIFTDNKLPKPLLKHALLHEFAHEKFEREKKKYGKKEEEKMADKFAKDYMSKNLTKQDSNDVLRHIRHKRINDVDTEDIIHDLEVIYNIDRADAENLIDMVDDSQKNYDLLKQQTPKTLENTDLKEWINTMVQLVKQGYPLTKIRKYYTKNNNDMLLLKTYLDENNIPYVKEPGKIDKDKDSQEFIYRSWRLKKESPLYDRYLSGQDIDTMIKKKKIEEDDNKSKDMNVYTCPYCKQIIEGEDEYNAMKEHLYNCTSGEASKIKESKLRELQGFDEETNPYPTGCRGCGLKTQQLKRYNLTGEWLCPECYNNYMENGP